MLTALWSAKGGVGVSVTAAMLALAQSEPCLLVDIDGDQPAILGESQPLGLALSHWLASPSDVGIDSLRRVEHRVTESLKLLLFTDSAEGKSSPRDADRLRVAAQLLAQSDRSVVVDVGCFDPAGTDMASEFAHAVLDVADHSLLVTTPCYLALRRAQAHPHLPTGLVLVDQPERALRHRDVTDALSVPIVCTVPHAAAVSRSVDAGLLASRIPTPARRSMKRYIGAVAA